MGGRVVQDEGVSQGQAAGKVAIGTVVSSTVFANEVTKLGAVQRAISRRSRGALADNKRCDNNFIASVQSGRNSIIPIADSRVIGIEQDPSIAVGRNGLRGRGNSGTRVEVVGLDTSGATLHPRLGCGDGDGSNFVALRETECSTRGREEVVRSKIFQDQVAQGVVVVTIVRKLVKVCVAAHVVFAVASAVVDVAVKSAAKMARN